MKERILKLIRKLDPSNPLEFTRELVAPLCKDKLNQLILECNDCKTCKNYEKKIAIGNPNANYLIINDNATDNEAINDYLNSILEAAEIPLNDVFIINSVSCIANIFYFIHCPKKNIRYITCYCYLFPISINIFFMHIVFFQVLYCFVVCIIQT